MLSLPPEPGPALMSMRSAIASGFNVSREETATRTGARYATFTQELEHSFLSGCGLAAEVCAAPSCAGSTEVRTCATWRWCLTAHEQGPLVRPGRRGSESMAAMRNTGAARGRTPAEPGKIDLGMDELREVTGFAAACAASALALFERERPDDARPRAALQAAQAFADGAARSKALRDAAWASQRAAHEASDAGHAAACEAARAALAAAGAAFLHPLAKATQVKHILGSAAHAARAFEFAQEDEPAVGAGHLARLRTLASPVVVDVLRRYQAAPNGGGRVGELLRELDAALRG